MKLPLGLVLHGTLYLSPVVNNCTMCVAGMANSVLFPESVAVACTVLVAGVVIDVVLDLLDVP